MLETIKHVVETMCEPLPNNQHAEIPRFKARANTIITINGRPVEDIEQHWLPDPNKPMLHFRVDVNNGYNQKQMFKANDTVAVRVFRLDPNTY